jgi:hypothetical protein
MRDRHGSVTIDLVSPEDLAAVDRSWAEVRADPDALVVRLTESFRAVTPTVRAEERASWLARSVAELVGLLRAPSQLGARARELATSWPDPGSSPSFRVDGKAWLAAVRDVDPTWTPGTDRAWRHAWLLLAEELAEEMLSPFSEASGPTP